MMAIRAKPSMMMNCSAPMDASLSWLVIGGTVNATIRKANARTAHRSIILFDKGPNADRGSFSERMTNASIMCPIIHAEKAYVCTVTASRFCDQA